MEPILQCHNLCKNYSQFPALNYLNMTLERGQIVGLLGPNGSGKTTLIKLICGLLTPSSGTLSVSGMAPGTETKKIISYLPERTYLNNWMRVRDLVSYFKDFYSDFDEAKAYAMLADLKIAPSARLHTLSKGTKEKVQLILIMSRSAELYILDEPIGGVDPASRDYILNTILSNYNENATVLISTHLIADVEQILDRVVFIQNGQLLLNKTVDEIRMEHKKSVDAFFREVFRC